MDQTQPLNTVWQRIVVHRERKLSILKDVKAGANLTRGRILKRPTALGLALGTYIYLNTVVRAVNGMGALHLKNKVGRNTLKAHCLKGRATVAKE